MEDDLVKIVVIIQARMKSKRVPGKVMRRILGKPILWHIKRRLEALKLINEITIATTCNKEDSAIKSFAKQNRIRVYRGSEDDLVDRLYKAAIKFEANAIVRIWADCPLIDPEIVDQLIQKFLDEKADYANNYHLRTFPYGTESEIYLTTALGRIQAETKDPFFREFPRAYIYEYKESFKIAILKSEVDLSSFHWDVNYPEDLEFVRGVFRKLYHKDRIFSLDDILRITQNRQS